MNKEEQERLKQKAAQSEPGNKEFFRKLKRRRKIPDLVPILKELHEEAFSKISCLECANCCRSISPIIYEKDIDRIARAFRMKPARVTEKYFIKDPEGDFVFRDTPCPFLLPENYCLIYDIRPKSCRDYPHTHQKSFISNYPLTIKNTYICPIAFYVVEKLKERIAF
jgi:Fe-S-cluster containining protein